MPFLLTSGTKSENSKDFCLVTSASRIVRSSFVIGASSAVFQHNTHTHTHTHTHTTQHNAPKTRSFFANG
jgi:hypothetical protein